MLSKTQSRRNRSESETIAYSRGLLYSNQSFYFSGTSTFNSPSKRIRSTDSNYSKNHEPVAKTCRTLDFNPASNRSELSINSANQEDITTLSSSHRTMDYPIQNVKQIYENHFSSIRDISHSLLVKLESLNKRCCSSQYNQEIELALAEHYLQTVCPYNQDSSVYTALRRHLMAALVQREHFIRDAYNRDSLRTFDEFVTGFIQYTKEYRVERETLSTTFEFLLYFLCFHYLSFRLFT